ncbi:cytochrome b/b6 domain-containing protein [Lacimicrobium alkaliphilum]|uniref:Cytochrome b561 bacterial/Ni-hydrogenase domain-containing protein n=1 Tax=Lacimicrobium alkaliphilum TaxID=1526571 RepID=A0A0U2JI81_9ALTE|nr:cytochrome b/b6 domain-containing protein [Lacimicrobium alkaliphilum]ALS97110.1 hypothetical protein AT746_01655 [Lacimicrobium alkaliphilum]
MNGVRVYVWDKVVRIFHWTLAGLFVTNYFVLEPGSNVHEWIGYSAVSLVLLRILYGFYAKGAANFSQINFSQSAFRAHFSHLKQRSLPQNAGHNPFGWLMVLVMFVLFIWMGSSGFLLEETDYFFGSDLMEQLHKLGADLLFICVCLHIVAVLLIGIIGRVSLIAPMLTGYRKCREAKK